MIMQLDLVEKVLLFQSALEQSEQQRGFCWNNHPLFNKHMNIKSM